MGGWRKRNALRRTRVTRPLTRCPCEPATGALDIRISKGAFTAGLIPIGRNWRIDAASRCRHDWLDAASPCFALCLLRYCERVESGSSQRPTLKKTLQAISGCAGARGRRGLADAGGTTALPVTNAERARTLGSLPFDHLARRGAASPANLARD